MCLLCSVFVIKDRAEQPDEEVHRVRSGGVPSVGASVPKELGCGPPSWHVVVVTDSEAPMKVILLLTIPGMRLAPNNRNLC